jgi:hypothetical protein
MAYGTPSYLSAPNKKYGNPHNKEYMNTRTGPGSSSKYMNTKPGGSIAKTYMKTPTGNDASQYLTAASARTMGYGKLARGMKKKEMGMY